MAGYHLSHITYLCAIVFSTKKDFDHLLMHPFIFRTRSFANINWHCSTEVSWMLVTNEQLLHSKQNFAFIYVSSHMPIGFCLRDYKRMTHNSICNVFLACSNLLCHAYLPSDLISKARSTRNPWLIKMVILFHNTFTLLSLESISAPTHELMLNEFSVNVLFLGQEKSNI